MVKLPPRDLEFDQIMDQITIELSLSQYDQLRKNCQIASPELRTLAHFTFDAGDGQTTGKRTVKITCDRDQATALLEFARRNCPELSPHLHRCIDQYQPAVSLVSVPRS